MPGHGTYFLICPTIPVCFLCNIAQQLLQERVGNRVQAMVLEKANALDLAFFEDAEFYDKLRKRKAFPLLAPKKPG